MATQFFDGVITTYASLVKEHKDQLTRLDEISGDGDFGFNLDSGLQASLTQTNTAGEGLLTAAANVFLDEVGGTSGPLFGLFFSKLDQAVNTGADTFDALRDGVVEGTEVIMKIGEAEVGDRTIVDCLAPAAEALKKATDASEYAAVLRAAVQGAVHTAEHVARRGRGSYVGDRVIGHPDPGAVGIAIFFVAVAKELGLDSVENSIVELFAAAE